MCSLVLTDVAKRFAAGQALQAVSLTINAGERVALVGESGSGKTTLLRIIAGLETPSSGKIQLDDVDVTAWAANRRGVGMVFQDYATYPRLSVAENLRASIVRHGLPKAEQDARIAELARWLGLTSLLQRLPAELSGGQVQRVALGKALMARPRVLLLDEPFSQLDVRLADQLRQLLAETHASYGMTQLIVTHHPLDALHHVDKLAVLHQGTLVHCDAPSQVRQKPKTLLAATLTSPCGLNVFPAEALPSLGAPAGSMVAVRPEKLHMTIEQAAPSSDHVVAWKCRSGTVRDLGIVSLREATFGAHRLSILNSTHAASISIDQEVIVWAERPDLMCFTA